MAFPAALHYGGRTVLAADEAGSKDDLVILVEHREGISQEQDA